MSKQFNARLPELTHEQIDSLSETHGLTKTQVVILAIDRFVRALESQNEDAQKDIRRLKTVARIAPHLDLGQDD
jgi:predicted DNA-binding protein